MLKYLKRQFCRTGLACCCSTPPISSHCCPDPIPAVLTVSISAPGCATLDGVSFTITYDGVRWIGSGSNNGHTVTVAQGNQTLMGSPYCPIAISCDGASIDASCLAMPGTMSCGPFLHTASCTATDPCGCTGTFTITVTITE